MILKVSLSDSRRESRNIECVSFVNSFSPAGQIENNVTQDDTSNDNLQHEKTAKLNITHIATCLPRSLDPDLDLDLGLGLDHDLDRDRETDLDLDLDFIFSSHGGE